MESPKWYQAGGRLQQIVLEDHRMNINDRTACIGCRALGLQGISGYNQHMSFIGGGATSTSYNTDSTDVLFMLKKKNLIITKS